MRRLLIVLVVLAALLVVADRVGVVVAENRLAGQIQQQLVLDSKPDVSIHGIPFLTQAIRGRYKDIRVELPRASLPPQIWKLYRENSGLGAPSPSVVLAVSEFPAETREEVASTIQEFGLQVD